MISHRVPLVATLGDVVGRVIVRAGRNFPLAAGQAATTDHPFSPNSIPEVALMDKTALFLGGDKSPKRY